MESTSADRVVSWLPVYHDLGLILKTMGPRVLGAEAHRGPPSLRDGARGRDALEGRRATFTAAPDFGGRLCLRRRLARRSPIVTAGSSSPRRHAWRA